MKIRRASCLVMWLPGGLLVSLDGGTLDPLRELFWNEVSPVSQPCLMLWTL